MIKCNIQLFKEQTIEVKGAPAAIYAELLELITVVLTKMNKEHRERMERKLRDESTGQTRNDDVISRKLKKGDD